MRGIVTGTTALLAGALLLSVAGPTKAASHDDWEPLVFELTLTRTVDPGDTFAVTHACRDWETNPECAFVHRLTILCSGDEGHQQNWGSPPCEAGTYRLELKREAGVTVDYGLARWVGSLAAEPTYMLRGSVTVPEGGITLRLGYDYSLGSQPPPPALPNTAARRSDPLLPLGLMVLTLSLVASSRAFGRPSTVTS